MKLNQKLIEKLRNGEIAVENSGTVEQLREVLKEASFKYTSIIMGGCKYYKMNKDFINEWVGVYSTDLPIKPISDFYQPELFTGWAKDDECPDWMFYFKDDIGQFGFSSDVGWTVNPDNKYSSDEDNRPATNEEIEQGLAEEAKRRGYKGGNTIKGLYGTSHWGSEISSFSYDQRYDRLFTNEGCIVYEAGQWAEIIEQPKGKPKTSPIHYTVGGTTYSLNYQELKAEYDNVVAYSDEGFMTNLPQIAHLACVVSYFKGLGVQATISDKGIIHELIHLMTEPKEPTNDLAEIRDKFNKLIQLV